MISSEQMVNDSVVRWSIGNWRGQNNLLEAALVVLCGLNSTLDDDDTVGLTCGGPKQP
jgi:hypothetical protein